jgi:hypothetical protein
MMRERVEVEVRKRRRAVCQLCASVWLGRGGRSVASEGRGRVQKCGREQERKIIYMIQDKQQSIHRVHANNQRAAQRCPGTTKRMADDVCSFWVWC